MYRRLLWKFTIGVVGLTGIVAAQSQEKAKTPDLPLLDLRGPTATDLKKLNWKTSDGKIERLLGPGSVIYDSDSMPSVYQLHYDPSRTVNGIHLSTKNISGNRTEPTGNANREFPWLHTAGTGDETTTIKLAYFPAPATLTKEWMQNPASGDAPDQTPTWVWKFAPGTKFVEFLIYKEQVYEIRLREKDTKSGWLPTVYRPFSQSEMKEESRWTKTTMTLTDKHPLPAFGNLTYSLMTPKKGTGPMFSTSSLPSTSEGQSKPNTASQFPPSSPPIMPSTMMPSPTLSAEKNSVRNLHPDNGTTFAGQTFASTDSDSPPKYTGGVPVSRENCMVCHRDTLKHVNEFQPFRDWYGRVRGSDGIFSWHPFDPTCIADKVTNHGKPLKIRPELKPYIKE